MRDRLRGAERTTVVDVLVTDVNLPRMSGPQLAEKARQGRPAVGVVFATGEAKVPGVSDATVLDKPYGGEVLLDAPARSGVGRLASGRNDRSGPRPAGVPASGRHPSSAFR